MNQTKKRLNIIKLAISITDEETIQLQILKLKLLKSDVHIQEIITLLEAKNYAQAQRLISVYIETPNEEILQRSEQNIIDEFQLFVVPDEQHNNQDEGIDINDFIDDTVTHTKGVKDVDFDTLLNVEAHDILPNNIDIDLSSTEKEKIQDSFFQESKKDDFFDEENIILKNEIDIPLPKKETDIDENLFHIDDTNEKNITSTFPAMPHLKQKLIDMKKRYPSIQKSNENFSNIETLISKISTDTYTEEDIEQKLYQIKNLISEKKYTEASQLLLLCAATESLFAQFMLARELYTGAILEKDISEAFNIMNTLAVNDYPEALCDLGQFYENGIGTTKNLIKAEGLYKEAVNLGIKRAKKHYNRLKKHNRGFFKG